MDISTAHAAARAEAARVPALQASLARLDAAPGPASITLYGAPRPDPGEPPAGDALVTIPLQQPAGAINEAERTIELAVPIEGQITGADPDDGTDAVWARITDGAGEWWGDCSVSDASGAGEIKLISTLLRNGAFARLVSAVFAG